jgi:hypothetical protein
MFGDLSLERSGYSFVDRVELYTSGLSREQVERAYDECPGHEQDAEQCHGGGLTRDAATVRQYGDAALIRVAGVNLDLRAGRGRVTGSLVASGSAFLGIRQRRAPTSTRCALSLSMRLKGPTMRRYSRDFREYRLEDRKGRRSMSRRGTGFRPVYGRILLLVAFLSMAVPIFALAEQNNAGLPIIPLKVVSNVDTTSSLFIYVKGIVGEKTDTIPQGTWVYVSDLKGNITIMPNIGPGDYTGELALNLGTAQTTAMKFPKLNAVRIYFSFGNPPMVCCSNAVGNSPSEPAGWVTSDPNFNILFDWAELVWDNGGNRGLGHTTRLGGNVTQVDMFGLPMQLTLKGISPSSNQPFTQNAGFTSDLQTMMKAYGQLGSPWTGLIVDNNMRVVSPYHGIALGIFPEDELDNYIDRVFMFYKSPNELRVTAACAQDGGITHTFAGDTSGDFLVFKENGVAKFRFPKPSTLRVYQNEIHPDPKPPTELYTCLAEVVAAKLGGAFVRTTLLANTDLDACKTDQFYVTDPIQKYAKFFHDFGINRKAYSYGYDDTCDQSSYINVDDPTAMTITLGGTTR